MTAIPLRIHACEGHHLLRRCRQARALTNWSGEKGPSASGRSALSVRVVFQAVAYPITAMSSMWMVCWVFRGHALHQ